VCLGHASYCPFGLIVLKMQQMNFEILNPNLSLSLSFGRNQNSS
jgi:hypothetical protein